jgi:hypothetical protein
MSSARSASIEGRSGDELILQFVTTAPPGATPRRVKALWSQVARAVDLFGLRGKLRAVVAVRDLGPPRRFSV